MTKKQKASVIKDVIAGFNGSEYIMDRVSEDLEEIICSVLEDAGLASYGKEFDEINRKLQIRVFVERIKK